MKVVARKNMQLPVPNIHISEISKPTHKNMQCDFCDSMCSKEYRCEGSKYQLLCPEAVGYDECQIKGRTACCCKDLVRPLKCSLQNRIVSLALLALSKRAFISSSK